MKRASGKSHCPINYTLEIIGDPWSLLILRDILHLGKRRYKEFLSSEERISTNILADRLARLEKQGIIEKRDEQYIPTEKGFALSPLLAEIALWGTLYDPQAPAPRTVLRQAKKSPGQFKRALLRLSEKNRKCREGDP